LRVLDIEALKSVPGTPTSHLFIERVIGTTRREYLDQLLFFNSRDLHNNLEQFQTYYNDVRAPSSLDMKTPGAVAFGEEPDEKIVSIDRYRWKNPLSVYMNCPWRLDIAFGTGQGYFPQTGASCALNRVLS
jgi:hypothetical protein